MAYTDEEIEQYLEILNNYTANQEVGDEDGDRHFRCWNCESDRFFFLLNQVTISVRSVELVMGMLLGFLT